VTPAQIIAFLHNDSKRADWTLALVVEATGSTPRKAGALMAISNSGMTCGSVGGGQGEAHMLAALRHDSGLASLLIDLRGGQNALGICGGQMRVSFARPNAAQLAAAISVLNSGAPAPAATLGFNGDNAPTVQPMPALVIAGGGHCGVALAELALVLGYQVLVHDDRAEALNLPPGCAYSTSWPEVLALLQGHQKPSVVLLTRSDALDVEALHFLQSWGAEQAKLANASWTGAFSYLGMMGSQRRIRAVQTQLAFSLAGVSAPVGLPIDAQTPAEIAVSIAAALIASRGEIQSSAKSNG